MARISELYQRSHDIDWFSKVGDIYVHAMSFGGLLPDAINDWDLLRSVFRKAYRIAPSVQNSFVYNNSYINTRLSDQYKELRADNEEQQEMIKNRYLHHFKEMAYRGFCSFDRDLLDENMYHLIVRPESPMKEWDIKLLTAEWPSMELVKAEDDNIIGFRIIREKNKN